MFDILGTNKRAQVNVTTENDKLEATQCTISIMKIIMGM